MGKHASFAKLASFWKRAKKYRRIKIYQMMEEQTMYIQLKKEVIVEAGKYPFSMEKVKDYFSRNINSKRSLAKVKHLKDVFQLLEKRNFLNSKNVKVIQNLGDLLENEKINELVHTYQKLCLDDEFEAVPCAVCGNCFPNTEEPLGEHQNSNFNDMNNYEADTELCQAMENIALNIRGKWGVLARALEIKEFQYDICTKTYPDDTVKQARMALQFWFAENKENANLQRLDKALEARLCKKEGFGVHLRLPIITEVPQF